MDWHDGTITFRDEQRGTMNAKVCITLPGCVVYSVAAGMSYAVPWTEVLEVTIDHSPFKRGDET